jgi:hypothetical protein
MQHDVIQQLVDDLQPSRPLMLMDPIKAAVLVGLALAALVFGFLGLRADFGHIPSIAKPTIFMMFAGFALAIGFYSAMPGQSTKIAKLPLVAVVALCIIYVLAHGLVGGIPAIQKGMQLPYGTFCAVTIGLLGLLPMALLLFWFQRTAPLNPAVTGTYLGLASGALAASAYAFHCNMDNVFYVSIWYVLPIVGHALIGRFIGSRILRW